MKRTFHRSTIYHRIRKKRIRLGLLANAVGNNTGTTPTDATNMAPAIPPTNPPVDTLLAIESDATSNSDAADNMRLLNERSVEYSQVAALDVPGAVKLFAMQAKSLTAADLKILLRLLHPLFPDLPLDPRTIRGTPRSCKKYNLKNGIYVHLGLPFCIERVHRQRPFTIGQNLKIQVNIDGLSVGDNPGKTIWPSIYLRNILVPRTVSFVNTIFQELRSIRSAVEQNTQELKRLQSAVQENAEKLLVIEPLIKNAHRFIMTTPPVRTPEIKSAIPPCGTAKFPLRSIEELHALEEDIVKPDSYAQFVTKLSRIPRASSVTECVSKVCSFVFSRELAKQVNWNGRNGKEPLMNSELQRAIIDAVCCPHNFPDNQRGKVEYRLMRWFQYRKPRKQEQQALENLSEPLTTSFDSHENVDMDLTEENL